MLTYDDALKASEFWHMTERNADGTAVRARRNGRTKVWKTRPGAFNVPVKYGLKQCFNITESHAHNWCTREKWEAEHVLFADIQLDATTVSPASVRLQQLVLAKRAFAQDPTPALAATIRQLEKGHA